MSSDALPLGPPKRSDFTLLISEISELLRPDLEDRIRNELSSPRTDGRVNEKPSISIREALAAIVKNMGKARKDLNAITAFFDAAEEYAAQQLKFHATFTAYVKRTTNQRVLRCELAPIRRLPNEIFQLIFVEVHAQSTEKERYNPVTAQVCTFWRELAHATPCLWTSVNVNLNEEEGAMGAVLQMETRIERAKGQLVSVQLSVKKPISTAAHSTASQENHPFTAAITTLLKYKDRVLSLHIPRHDDRLGGDLTKRCEKEKIVFKNLRTLFLYDVGRFNANLNARPLLDGCPNMERLRIFRTSATSAVHWEKIKEFKGFLNAQALSEFLARARDVMQADIASSTWHTLPTITFNDRLTALSLDLLHEDCAKSLARVGPPPSLRYLSITSPYISLLASWGSGLEFLALPFGVTAQYLKTLLRATPNLEGLRICGDRATPPNLFGLLPKLTHLELYTGHKGESEQSVRKTLSRPLHPTSRGKRLRLQSVAFLPEDNPNRRYMVASRFEDAAQLWNPLYQDLKDLGIEVHEYRWLEDFDACTFKTAFFVERGWCI